MLVELHRRVQFEGLETAEPYLTGQYSELTTAHDSEDSQTITEAIAYLEQYADALGEANQQVMAITRSKNSAGDLADYIAGLLNLPFETRSNCWLPPTANGGCKSPSSSSSRNCASPKYATKSSRMPAKVPTNSAQREYLLREQMRAIRKELGEDGESVPDELRQKIEAANMPEDVRDRAMKELKRLEYQGQQSAEASVIRTYLEWLVELPWDNATEDNLAHPPRP